MLRDKVIRDLRDALKEKRELELSVLRMLSSALSNRKIEKRGRMSKSGTPVSELGEKLQLSEEEMNEVLRSEVKKRKEAASEFQKGGRSDLAEKESQELKILEKYLPQELSDEEVEKIVKEIVTRLGDVSEKNFGRVMGEVMKQVKGQAAGERVSAMVKKYLLK